MAQVSIQKPYYPIIYVRGYAGTEAEVEETVATPYMGFNLGATKLRQRWTGDVDKVFFESPLIRLMKDHGYRDVYDGGEILDGPGSVPPKSVTIYRYYDQVSPTLGSGDRPEIEIYAAGLSDLVDRLEERVCGDDQEARDAFRVYLVAHSMGGLICRCFLQNPEIGTQRAKERVDKVFTYATPHNGIDVRILGNVPAFFTANSLDNFNRDRMREYLALSDDSENVNSLDGRFDPQRFFCLVGTNARDYDVARGWSSRMVGPMSDGLVRIDSAVVKQAPRAFVHRSHSGHYGIVNSEEGYQNLQRFLFGNVRIEGRLRVHGITLPPRVERAREKGREIRASYHFETIVRVRGARYDLHRRTTEEESAIFRTFDEVVRGDVVGRVRNPVLFSQFLSVTSRRSKALTASVEIRVRVPEYEIDRLLLDDHIEGSYLYRDAITVAAVPPADEDGFWSVRYGYDSKTPGRTSRTAERGPDDTLTFADDPETASQVVVHRIPIVSKTKPGIDATLELVVSPWS